MYGTVAAYGCTLFMKPLPVADFWSSKSYLRAHVSGGRPGVREGGRGGDDRDGKRHCHARKVARVNDCIKLLVRARLDERRERLVVALHGGGCVSANAGA